MSRPAPRGSVVTAAGTVRTQYWVVRRQTAALTKSAVKAAFRTVIFIEESYLTRHAMLIEDWLECYDGWIVVHISFGVS